MLTLKIGRRLTCNVADLAEASAVYSIARDESGEGVSTFPEGKIVQFGKSIARVSYNGRVWSADDRILFDTRVVA